MRLFAFTIPFLFFAHSTLGQAKSDSLIKMYLGLAKEQISLNNYSSANDYIKKIFALKTTLPDEVAYYYGLTLLKLDNHAKGKEALEKYMELTGEQGTFYEEAKQLVTEADKHICKKCNNTGVAEVTDTCTFCKGLGQVEVDCDFCKSKGVEFCSACGGKGVFIEQGNFGSTYSTCKKCSGKGYIGCHVCNGTKKKSLSCKECKGTGGFKRKISCSH